MNTHQNFNIKGAAIGNPLLRLDRDVPATSEYFWSHGMISDEVGLAIMNQCDFDDYTFGSPHNVSQACNKAISEANTIVSEYINNYDVILDVCYPSIVEQELRLRKMCSELQRHRRKHQYSSFAQKNSGKPYSCLDFQRRPRFCCAIAWIQDPCMRASS